MNILYLLLCYDTKIYDFKLYLIACENIACHYTLKSKHVIFCSIFTSNFSECKVTNY